MYVRSCVTSVTASTLCYWPGHLSRQNFQGLSLISFSWYYFLQTGFVKAFSEYPHLFTSGFCQVEKIMQNTFVEKLFLWPRYEKEMSGALDVLAFPSVVSWPIWCIL